MSGISLGPWLLAATLVPGTPQAGQPRVKYLDVPAGAETAAVLEWRDAGGPLAGERIRLSASEPVSLRHEPGHLVVVVFARADNSYVVDGPFVWPRYDESRRADVDWRRTLEGVAAAGVTGTPSLSLAFAARQASSILPACFWQDERRWTCFGVPLRVPVIVLWTRLADTLWWTMVAENGGGAWQRSEWARVLVVSAAAAPIQELRVTLTHAVAPPARLRNVRLGVAAVADAHVVWLNRSTAWVAASRPPPAAWAEVRARESAPRYLLLDELASGPTELPVPVLLESERMLEGRAVSAGQPAAGALITLCRLIDPAPEPGERIKPRRVTVAEGVADEEGRFRFGEMGDVPYEVVAWHPQFGRASVILTSAQSNIDVQLTPAGVARGRVLVGGKAASGVDVFSVPDMTAFAAAEDPMDVKGGDARTGADGRFLVTVAPSGGGELRIGGGQYAVMRIPLPPSALPIVDVGDVELAGAIQVSVVLDQDPGCSLRAVGPLGRAGLHVVNAVRSGPGLFQLSVPEAGAWQVDLDCAGTERALVPPTIQATPAMAGKEVRLMVR
jgi:hypothetical protein